MPNPISTLPVVDISSLFQLSGRTHAPVASAIEMACRDTGFFYISNHGISADAVSRLDAASRKFFALPLDVKNRIAMSNAGRAWRGFFPVGGELTSGRPDLKEGVYFGTELDADDPRVIAGLPMHGANLWPEEVPELRAAVLDFIAQATLAAHAVMRGIALSLGLDQEYFTRTYTSDPTVLFRVFHYPPARAVDGEWGVGEHTDYGLLTLLAQDACGGLQVKSRNGWIEAPPLPDTLVCNIGDMLDRLTGGYYRSTPHRVRNVSGRDRLSFPLFFDPGFDAVIEPLPERAGEAHDDSAERWDCANLHAFKGTYGDYLLGKVGKVFPDLQQKLL
ncbi:MAG: 2-oxoglutarate and iron-dependent oxygenase domain-containing protein [Micropepsaceae bacterium]